MKTIRLIASALLLALSLTAQAQLTDAHLFAELNRWSTQGWEIQQRSVSYDGNTIIFAGRPSADQNYDLYMTTRTGESWSDAVRLPAPVNTREDELWPSLSSDEQQLFFVRRQPADPKDKKAEDHYTILICYRQAGGWSEPTTLIISSGFDISPRLLPDNKTLLFASRRANEDGDVPTEYSIYYTRKVNKYDWYDPQPIAVPAEKNISFYGPEQVLKNGQLMLQFTRRTLQKKKYLYESELMEYPSGFRAQAVLTLAGKTQDEVSHQSLPADIYIYDILTGKQLSRLSSNGAFRVALPAGTNYRVDITAADYSHTYLEYDCRNLQRDSSAHVSVSLSRDLQVRVNLFDSERDLPVRVDSVATDGAEGLIRPGYVDMRLPIGREYKLRFYKRGYQAADLTVNTDKPVLLTRSETDLDLVPGKAPLRLTVRDEESGQNIEALIRIYDMTDREPEPYEAEGMYLRQGHDYAIHIDAVGYLFADSSLTVSYAEDTVVCDFRLLSIQKDLIMRLRNIQFDYNSAELMEESFDELNKVVRLLEINPDLRIELSAHTDDQGSDRYNDLLSRKRGEAARSYLIRRGVDASRVTATGYGKRKPLVPNDSDEHRAMNRRVEFKVL